MRKIFEIVPNIGTEYFLLLCRKKDCFVVVWRLDSLKSTYIGDVSVGWEAPNLWRKKCDNSLNASVHEVGVHEEEI